MKHTMHLQPQPFSMIRSGEKTIELRLYDEKRQQIAVNDEIEFCCPECGQTPYTVRVKAMHRFRNFAELYAALPLLRCGYTGETLASASPDDMNAYYSPQEQAKYGVVGIEVKPILQDGALLRASRFLSLVLRHKPEAAGITLDSHGWAEVDALLAGMAPRHTLTMAQLEEIVRTDDKQRYAFNDSKTKIRANQGHSVPVDVELTECEPPELLYHGTGGKICRQHPGTRPDPQIQALRASLKRRGDGQAGRPPPWYAGGLYRAERRDAPPWYPLLPRRKRRLADRARTQSILILV